MRLVEIGIFLIELSPDFQLQILPADRPKL